MTKWDQDDRDIRPGIWMYSRSMGLFVWTSWTKLLIILVNTDFHPFLKRWQSEAQLKATMRKLVRTTRQSLMKTCSIRTQLKQFFRCLNCDQVFFIILLFTAAVVSSTFFSRNPRAHPRHCICQTPPKQSVNQPVFWPLCFVPIFCMCLQWGPPAVRWHLPLWNA